MTAAIFGLIGVIIGSLLQGTVSFAMERHRTSLVARKAARRLLPRITQCGEAVEQAINTPDEMNWQTLLLFVGHELEDWPTHADALAGTLRSSEWFPIDRGVQALEGLTWAAPSDPDAVIGEQKAALLHPILDATHAAVVQLSIVGFAGLGGHRTRRWFRGQWQRFRPPPSDEEVIRRVFGEEAAQEWLEAEREIERTGQA